jgi:ketosteroid isomerase-like protein
MADSAGRVCVLVQVSGTRPDGRSFDDPEGALFTVEDGKVHSVEQYVGDTAPVTAFWA